MYKIMDFAPSFWMTVQPFKPSLMVLSLSWHAACTSHCRVKDMSIQEWQAYGYIVLIVDRMVYLFRPIAEVGYVTAEDNGAWKEHRNVNCLPWRFVNYRQKPELLNRFKEMERSLSAA
jgi:hypothetical protein